MSQTWQFTVGSLPNTRGRSEGFFNFEHELELLKAALLYADRVKVCSVGAAFMAGLEDLRNMDGNGKTTLIQKFLPYIQPDATPEHLARTRRLMEAASANGKRGKSARRGLSGPDTFRRVANHSDGKPIVELSVDYSVPDIAQFTLRVGRWWGTEELEEVWRHPGQDRG